MERSKVIERLTVARIIVAKVNPAPVVTQIDKEGEQKKIQELREALRKEQEHEATKALALALERFPENVVEAKVVGNLEKGDSQNSNVTVKVKLRFMVNIKAYEALVERLRKPLEVLAEKRWEFTVLACEHGEREYRSNEIQGELPYAFNLLGVNTHRTKAHDRSEWVGYRLPSDANRLLSACCMKSAHVKLSLLDSSDAAIAVDRFDAKEGNWLPMPIWTGLAAPFNRFCAISPYFLEKFDEDSAPSIETERARHNTTYRTELEMSRSISLDVEDVTRIQNIRCELMWKD